MIFVGGTGRSGSTILAEILGKHPEIYFLPEELRFIIDPDGILSLKSILVDNWSFYQADFAIDRFYKLMRYLSSRYVGKYPILPLKNHVGKDFYYHWLDSYINEICQYSFKNAWGARSNLFRLVLLRFFGRNRLTEIFLERSYYGAPLTEEEFFSITNRYLKNFFSRAASLHGKKQVVEHTPSNIIHAEFLYKLFPEMKLIHIYRDPRDIIASYMTKIWASRDIKVNMKLISNVLDRWQLIKEKIPKYTYYELKFENLINDFGSAIKKLCDFLNIQFHDCILDIDISLHNIGRWKHELNDEEKKYFYNNYRYLLERYGYT